MIFHDKEPSEVTFKFAQLMSSFCQMLALNMYFAIAIDFLGSFEVTVVERKNKTGLTSCYTRNVFPFRSTSVMCSNAKGI